MKNVKWLQMVLVTGILMLSNVVNAQKDFTLVTNPSLEISGTSSLHDWEMKSSKATGSAKMTLNGNDLSSISSLSITMIAETLESGKNAMDKKAFEAMKTDKYKSVSFVLSSAKKNSDGSWNLTGNFTIAGSKKSVTVKATENVSNGVVQLKGTYSFKLTDYGITPPKALAGTIKTGDAVKISFNVKFK